MVKLRTIILLSLVAVMSSAAVADDIPSLQSEGIPQYYLLKLGGALLLVLLIFMGFTWVMRRFNRLQSNHCGMKVVGGMSIGTKEKVLIIEVAGQQLLLGVTPTCINKLMVINPDTDVSAADLQRGKFGETLKQAQRNEEDL